MATIDDIHNDLTNISRQLGEWVKAYNGRNIAGTFTLTAGTTTVVSDPNTTSNSVIALNPSNGTAAATVKTAGLYVAAYTAGVGFSVSTQSGTAAGTETFRYTLFNPS